MPYPKLLVTAPAREPLDSADVASLLQLGSTDHSAWLEARIIAARQKVEMDTGRALMTQTWDVYLDAFPADAIVVPIGPLQSVTSIKTTTAAGVQSTVAATNYQVDIASDPGRIVLSDTGAWPSDLRRVQPIVIRIVVGYGDDPGDIPQSLVWAMEQLLAQWYATRVGSQYVPPVRWLGYDATLDAYRPSGIA